VGTGTAAYRSTSAGRASMARNSRPQVGVSAAMPAHSGPDRSPATAAAGSRTISVSARASAASRSPAATSSSNGSSAAPATGPPTGSGGS
jgi:hypothetical protein